MNACDIAKFEFFTGIGISSRDLSQYLSCRYSDFSIKPLDAGKQGGCSFTFVVEKNDKKQSVISQFRLLKYAIDRDVACEARKIYGSLVPKPLRFDTFRDQLQVCEMGIIKGVRACDILDEDLEGLKRLLSGLVEFFRLGWKNAIGKNMMNAGKIGSSMESRLRKLGYELPTAGLRNVANRALVSMKKGGLECLPIVLNHGDLLPSNILVDPKTWNLNGIVDWAEAEFLPFGMSLYGVEHLLGSLQEVNGGHVFSYFRQADELRDFFWSCLCRVIPELDTIEVRQAVELSRTIGILLWHGFAWDEGRLDRVVDFQTDATELAYLQAFLNLRVSSATSKL